MTSSLENDYAETLSLAKNIFDNMVIEKGEYALQYNTILALTSMIFEEHFKARSSKNAMQLLKLECFPGEVSEMSHLDAACALYVPSFLGSICLVVDNERVEFTISKSKNDSSVESILCEAKSAPKTFSIISILNECSSNKPGYRHRYEDKIEIDGEEYIRVELWKPFLPLNMLEFVGLTVKERCSVYVEMCFFFI